VGLINNLSALTFMSPSETSVPSPTTRVQAAPPLEDQVQLAKIPVVALAEQQIQDKNPPNLQAVLGDAIRNLRAAALQSTDPVEAAYLSGLADRFQRLEEAGDASAPSNSVQDLSS
jgi:hypothetical protein